MGPSRTRDRHDRQVTGAGAHPGAPADGYLPGRAIPVAPALAVLRAGLGLVLLPAKVIVTVLVGLAAGILWAVTRAYPERWY